jgi:hypothetical protein
MLHFYPVERSNMHTCPNHQSNDDIRVKYVQHQTKQSSEKYSSSESKRRKERASMLQSQQHVMESLQISEISKAKLADQM